MDLRQPLRLSNYLLLFFLLALFLRETRVSAQEAPPKLVVATRHTPPFAIKQENGTWTGISIDLWAQIAEENRWSYEFQEMTLDQMLEKVATGKVDVVVAALSVTGEREERMDFTHPFYTSGLGMAVRTKKSTAMSQAWRQIWSAGLIRISLITLGLVAAIGLVAYFLERKRNSEQFGVGFLKGWGRGTWWAVVTATTVGYGDSVPKSIGGKALAVVWMFAGIVLISTFTASLSAALTVNELNLSTLDGPEDLANVRVGMVEHSTGANYIRMQALNGKEYESAEKALVALLADRSEIDVVVYDEPILRYLAFNQLEGQVRVLPKIFQRQDYGIAFPAQSTLREPSNRSVLKIIMKGEWQKRLENYLGKG